MSLIEELLKTKKKGCLHGKTPTQKKSFFVSLLRFYGRDKAFFREQVLDLQPTEKLELIEYLINNNNNTLQNG